jgi:ABC-type molybdate transport system substrate-binding protein
MRSKIYVLGLVCILLISCTDKKGSPIGPTDLAEKSKPIISYFTATPSTIELGEKSTLAWKVDNCTSVEIDEGIGKVSPTGSIEVSPSETTTYTLKAMNQEYNDQTHTYVTYAGAGSEKLCTITVEK